MKNIERILLPLLFFTGTASAATLAQVTKVECTSAQGGYLTMDLKAQTTEGRLGTLPVMTNVADGEKMPVEFLKEEDGFVSLIALTTDSKNELVGSLAVFAKEKEELASEVSLQVVFRGLNCQSQQEQMKCHLTF